MASLSSLPFLLLLFTATTFALVAGDTFSLDFHHRFSYKVRQWAESQGLPAMWHPAEAPERSVEYYNELVRHDRALLSQHRRLITSTDVYTFAMGNETLSLPSLAYLHYAVVTVGTPNQTFLVAMDTGSDLFWLPCNCMECAPLTSPLYSDLKFSTYRTNASSTSKTISCGSSQCSLLANQDCNGTSTDSCPYIINYATANTSSSGFLVEDVLYMAKGDTGVDTVEIPVVLGCGEVQTGILLEGGAPNGLMGLGMDNLSVPTVLANKGLISDSFSLCFGTDDSGRINFGDRGSSDQSETPLIVDNNNSVSYNIIVEGMVIGNTTSDTSFTAIVDSGASFTILADQIYKEFTTTFTEQVTETQMSYPNLSFEYCYQLSAGQTDALIPEVNFTTKGGSQFPVLNPIVFILSKTNEPVGYCLGVLPSTNINIIGQNFLRGLRVVFDREKMILGWEQFDCYGSKSSTTLPTDKKPFAPPPAGHSTPSTQVPATETPVAQAPAQPQSEANQPHRLKSWAPKLSPSTILNTAVCLFLVFFVMFYSTH